MYRLSRFGDVTLPTTNQVDDVGSGETPTAFHPLPGGGALDMLGNAKMYPAVVSRSKQVRIAASSASNLQSTYLELMALVGSRNRLYRELPDGTTHWQYARLKAVQASRDYQLAQYKRLQDLTIVFETMEATWRGDRVGVWFFDEEPPILFDEDPPYEFDDDGGAKVSLTSSPTVFDENPGGNAPVRNLVWLVYAGSDATMSNITIKRTNGEQISFNGTIPIDGVLKINLGTMQVYNVHTEAYDDLTLDDGADGDAWFQLLADTDNEITVTFTGGGTGAYIMPCYYKSWR
jgi:hypothetical protein